MKTGFSGRVDNVLIRGAAIPVYGGELLATRGRCVVRTTTRTAGLPTHRAPTHPGEMLLEEFLRPMGVTQIAAAKKLSISTNRLNELIRGKRGVTADTALRLARWLGTTPQFWMHLQVSWDLWQAAKKRSVA